jgi:hypothetical protein
MTVFMGERPWTSRVGAADLLHLEKSALGTQGNHRGAAEGGNGDRAANHGKRDGQGENERFHQEAPVQGSSHLGRDLACLV